MTVLELDSLQTESINPRTVRLDSFSTVELLEAMNEEDLKVVRSVSTVLPIIAEVVNVLYPKVRDGGRLFYIGAGTSGRLGILDASEIPPTFSASYDQFVGLIAGGDEAMRRALENAEDSTTAAAKDLARFNLNPELDTVLGIASSGRTPYVIGGLKYAKLRGCITIGLACLGPSEMERAGCTDYMITAITGPEIITGSTRLKAGTATKLILNMISTATMVRIGKTYGNLMVDLMPTNIKLRERMIRIFRSICGDSFYVFEDGKISERAVLVHQNSEGSKIIDSFIRHCGDNLKVAVIVAKCGINISDANNVLKTSKGILSVALENVSKTLSSEGIITRSEAPRNVPKWNMCMDIDQDFIRVSIFDMVQFESHEARRTSELSMDILSVIKKMRAKVGTGEKSNSLMGMKSIRISVSFEPETKKTEDLVIDVVQNSCGFPKSKIQVSYGKCDYNGLLKELF